jgi:hypothetical protein
LHPCFVMMPSSVSDYGDLMSPVSYEAVVHLKEHAATILAQVDREGGLDQRVRSPLEDGMEVSCFHIAFPISTHHRVESISTSAYFSSSTTFQVVPLPGGSHTCSATMALSLVPAFIRLKLWWCSNTAMAGPAAISFVYMRDFHINLRHRPGIHC